MGPDGAPSRVAPYAPVPTGRRRARVARFSPSGSCTTTDVWESTGTANWASDRCCTATAPLSVGSRPPRAPPPTLEPPEGSETVSTAAATQARTTTQRLRITAPRIGGPRDKAPAAPRTTPDRQVTSHVPRRGRHGQCYPLWRVGRAEADRSASECAGGRLGPSSAGRVRGAQSRVRQPPEVQNFRRLVHLNEECSAPPPQGRSQPHCECPLQGRHALPVLPEPSRSRPDTDP